MCCRVLAHEALSLSPLCDATGMSCACARGLIVVAHLATRPACRALAHKALSLSPSCDATGMSCACAQGLIVVACLATRPACRALAHEALLSLPSCNTTGMLCACARGLIVVAIVRRNRHVVHFRTRPYRGCHRATRPACRALAHEALSSLPSCDVTGMSCTCAQGLIVVARLATRPACCALAHEALSSLPVWRCDRHVVRLRTRPYCRRPSGNVMYEALSSTLLTSLP
jgi:hypothetical protein